MLDFSDESIIVRIAVVAGVIALVLTLIFLLTAFALRGILTRRALRRKVVEEQWRPLMLASLRDPEVETPRVRRRHRALVLAQWVRLINPIEGEAAERLRAFARRADLVQLARRIVRRGSSQERLVAAVFLGEQQDLESVRVLRDLAGDDELVVRVEAARALVRIDPDAGARAVAPLVASWEDCHPAMAVAVFESAPPDTTARALAPVVLTERDPEEQARLVEILGAFRAPTTLDAARALLARSDAPEVISRCLAVLRTYRDPRDAPVVRRHLAHPMAFVRVQAVATLGRFHVATDQWLLYAALSDPDWWVRHRAAHALVAHPGIDADELAELAARHPDEFARGALEQAVSETRATR